jgi:hypothetical protein
VGARTKQKKHALFCKQPSTQNKEPGLARVPVVLMVGRVVSAVGVERSLADHRGGEGQERSRFGLAVSGQKPPIRVSRLPRISVAVENIASKTLPYIYAP